MATTEQREAIVIYKLTISDEFGSHTTHHFTQELAQESLKDFLESQREGAGEEEEDVEEEEAEGDEAGTQGEDTESEDLVEYAITERGIVFPTDTSEAHHDMLDLILRTDRDWSYFEERCEREEETDTETVWDIVHSMRNRIASLLTKYTVFDADQMDTPSAQGQ